jgi:hypothetical protein
MDCFSYVGSVCVLTNLMVIGYLVMHLHAIITMNLKLKKTENEPSIKILMEEDFSIIVELTLLVLRSIKTFFLFWNFSFYSLRNMKRKKLRTCYL